MKGAAITCAGSPCITWRYLHITRRTALVILISVLGNTLLLHRVIYCGQLLYLVEYHLGTTISRTSHLTEVPLCVATLIYLLHSSGLCAWHWISRIFLRIFSRTFYETDLLKKTKHLILITTWLRLRNYCRSRAFSELHNLVLGCISPNDVYEELG